MNISLRFLTHVVPAMMIRLLLRSLKNVAFFLSFLASLVFSSTWAYANKSLVYCSEGSPKTFDPAMGITITAAEAGSNAVFNRLVEFKSGSTDIEPGLATNWSISKDGLTYTFHLRKGISFHTTPWFQPTRNMNADDVVFSFDRMLHGASNPFQKIYRQVYPYFSDMGMIGALKSIKKIDDYTVVFHLRRKQAPFLRNMAMGFSSIVSKEYANMLLVRAGRVSTMVAKKRIANQFQFKPIGTGPFVFINYQQDNFIRYRANRKYWRTKVNLDTLIFSISIDPNVRTEKLISGECDVAGELSPNNIKELKKYKNINLLRANVLSMDYVSYNTQKKILSDQRVRIALTMALDKKYIVNKEFQGTAVVANAPIPPAQWGHDPNLPKIPYDVKRAKELLKEAGYPNGFNISLAIETSNGFYANQRLLATILQSYWAKIGVRVTIRSYEAGTFYALARTGVHEIMLAGWAGDNGDPDDWFFTLLSCDAVHGNNMSKFCYKPFNDLITEAQITLDKKKRLELYTKAQEIFIRKMPFMPLAYPKFYEPVRKRVIGFKINPFTVSDFQFVDVKQ